MAEGNLRLVARFIDAYNRRDGSTLEQLSDPELEWSPAIAQALEQGVYRGHDGLRRYLADIEDTWDEMRIVIDDIRDMGDRIVLLGRVRGRGRLSGVVVDEPFGTFTELSEGKVARMRAFLAHDPALALAGLGD
jgi:uncharacterized protein